MCGPFADQIGYCLFAVIGPANDGGEGEEEKCDRHDPGADHRNGGGIGACGDGGRIRVRLPGVGHIYQDFGIAGCVEGFLRDLDLSGCLASQKIGLGCRAHCGDLRLAPVFIGGREQVRHAIFGAIGSVRVHRHFDARIETGFCRHQRGAFLEVALNRQDDQRRHRADDDRVDEHADHGDLALHDRILGLGSGVRDRGRALTSLVREQAAGNTVANRLHDAIASGATGRFLPANRRSDDLHEGARHLVGVHDQNEEGDEHIQAGHDGDDLAGK